MFSQLEKFRQVVVDEVSPTVTYIGYALSGTPTSSSGWFIQKIDSTLNPTTILFPQYNGKPSSKFIFSWDDRTTYTYSFS